LEGLAGGPSHRNVAHLFNRFSTGVEKFLHFKVLKGFHFQHRRLRRGAMLCQPILLPTSYGAGVTGVVTSRAEAKLRAANVVPKNTSAIPGTTPGKRGRFIEGLPFEALSRSDFFLVLDAAHYSTASDDDVNTLFPSEVKIFFARR
jgi:hypothetical protein